MKKYSIRAFGGLFQIAVIAAFLALDPKAVLLADINIDSAPAAATNTASAASTNAAPKTTTSGASITIDSDDDDSADDKGPKHFEKIRIGGDHGSGDALVTLEAFIIPLAGIVATFATPILIVYFVCYFNYRRRQANLDLAREYLSKGMPVPAELLDSSQVGRVTIVGRDGSGCCPDLRKGFKLTFIGLGVSLALYIFSPHGSMWGWGLIPMVMGIGYLISGWAESRREAKLPERATTPPPDKPA